ncbi:FtsX-like permease family protein [Candidatus Saccharibacteria bacterium]|nr:FtsX-like permease family protein [Candidatus Saccharibacteria bacterium]
MRLLFINHAQNAYQSLRGSRVRSMLTMLGVTIGVASITAILSLSGGAVQIIADQINSLNGNIAVIRPGAISSQNTLTDITQNQLKHSYAISSLSETDVADISQIEHIKNVAPMMVLSSSVKGDLSTQENTQILATTPDFIDISNLKIKSGQFLDSTINQNTIVIGQQLSIDIFGTDLALGKVLAAHGQNFTVIGILSRVNNSINYNSIDFDNAAIVNFGSGKKLNKGVVQIQQIDVTADEKNNLPSVIKAINNTLLKNHGNEQDFSILSGDKIAQPTSQLFYAVAGASAAIAAISLIVGGIGIMNIMLVTVAERTREIGIRKALGASHRDIVYQFLFESLAISIIGGLVGYVIGYILSFAISKIYALTFLPAITWQIAVAAFGISVVLGTVFGLYPALRAAYKDPVESLQRYN